LVAAVAPAAGVGSGQVKLRWSAPAANGSPITDYVIERSAGGAAWMAVGDGVSTATSATVSGLANGSRYSFRVAAVNALGTGPGSAIVTATPASAPGVAGGLVAAVAPVVGVASGQVRLTWLAPAANGSAITDYVIQRSSNRITWTTINDGVSTTRSRFVSGLSNGTRYWFRVAARNAAGQAAWSVPATGVPRWKPGGPAGLRAVPGSRRVTLTWAAPVQNGATITDYVIQRSAKGQRWITVRDGVSTARVSVVTRLTNGVGYRFRVAARNAAGLGLWSATVRARPIAR
jgi:titin